MDRLQSMRVFERVVNEGGFAAAARALDLSAPVVTRLVADLEEHLGARLLQRSTRRLSLTDAGEQYLQRVRSILQDIDEADASVSAQTHELAGQLRLHAPPVLASYVISPLLTAFRQRYPKILIELEVASLHEPPVGDFDITLLGTDQGLSGDVIARQVIASEAILVAAPDYLKRRGTPLQPQDLARHDCLRLKMPDSNARLWRMWCPDQPQEVRHVEVQPVLLANHTDTLLRAAMDGAGITSVAIDVVAPALTSGALVRVLAPWITGRLVMYAAMPSRKFVPQRTRVFLDFLLEETRQRKDRALAACTVC